MRMRSVAIAVRDTATCSSLPAAATLNQSGMWWPSCRARNVLCTLLIASHLRPRTSPGRHPVITEELPDLLPITQHLVDS
jgi:hypothetical protein